LRWVCVVDVTGSSVVEPVVRMAGLSALPLLSESFT
jgi:hypothetical protein